MSTREQLIEKAAKAIYEAGVSRDFADADWTEIEQAELGARVVLAVFEEAHDTEVEELKRQIAKLDADLSREVVRVEELHNIADRLSWAIAPVEIIGEHSSANDPWENAIEYAEAHAPTEDEREALNTLYWKHPDGHTTGLSSDAIDALVAAGFRRTVQGRPTERIDQAIAYIRASWLGNGEPTRNSPAGEIIAILRGERTFGEPQGEPSDDGHLITDCEHGVNSLYDRCAPCEAAEQGEPSDAAVRAALGVLYEDWEHFDFDDPDDWEDAAYAQVRAALRAAAETGPQGEPSARDLLDAIYDPEEDSESDSVRIGFVVE